KASVNVTRSRRLNLELFLDHSRPDAGSGTALISRKISMTIGVDVHRGIVASFRNWASESLRPQRWTGKSLALTGAMVCLVISVSITLFVLSRDAARLRARVSQLHQENSELQSQLSEIQALRQLIAQLQQEKSGTSNLNPLSVESDVQLSQVLHDDSRVVALDAKGNLVRAEWIPPEFQPLVKTALETGRVEVRRSLPRNQAAVLMGRGSADSFALVSPVGVLVEEDQPTLRWNPLNGATSYSVRISDSEYKEA